MYGPNGKLGRGGGGGNRKNIHTPPIKRPATTSHLSVGRGGLSSSAAVATPSTAALMQTEESFAIVRENPLNIGMAIKLAPNLVEEIKRVEAEGGSARIKFDAYANNPNGNVIQVGNKTFRFTWSKEPEDKCDIYEEHQSGRDGTGLLVEMGATSHKLNVERELDESTQNHVKRRSEEAEHKLKSRKAIVLDHRTPTTQNRLKSHAAAESNSWRNSFKQPKEPPFKKLKSEQPSAAGYKSGLPASSLSKIKTSSGPPLSSQLKQQSSIASQVVNGNLVKRHTSLAEAVPKKSNATNSDKEMHAKLPSSTTREKLKLNQNIKAKPIDLRSFIISLFLEHQPYGMKRKALEKAVGDFMPNSVRQMEPILRQVATFQAPGKYFLKQGVELESYKKPPPQSENSPELSRHESPAPQKFDQFRSQDLSFSIKTAVRDEQRCDLNYIPAHTVGNAEKIDTVANSSEQIIVKQVADNTEQVAICSSESDSSDDSSDGENHGRSKSQSPVGSRSWSSDGESDATSDSKQASDEDVDIMISEDEKESKNNLQDIDPVSSKSPLTWNDLDNGFVDTGNLEKHDNHISDLVNIEKDLPHDAHEAERSMVDYAVRIEGEEPAEGIINPTSFVQQETQDPDGEAYDGLNSVVNNGIKHGQSGVIRKSLKKGKSKRLLDDKHSDEGPQNRKKLKSQLLSGSMSSLFGECPNNSSPDRPLHVPGNVNLTRVTSVYKNFTSQTCFSKVVPDSSVCDAEQLGKNSLSGSASSEVPSGERRSDKQQSLDQGAKYSERSLQASDGHGTQRGLDAGTRSKDGLVNGKRPPSHPYTHCSNSSEDNKTSSMERSQVMNGVGGVTQRAHLDLELDGSREPFNVEISGMDKQSERNSSVRNLENESVGSEHWNSNIGRVKTSSNITADGMDLSLPNFEATGSVHPDETSKKKTMGHNSDACTKSYQKTTLYLNQHSDIEVGSKQNKGREIGKRSRFVGNGTDQGARLRSYKDPLKKVSITQQESDIGFHTTKENDKWIPNVAGFSKERQKFASLTGQNGASKTKESSLDAGSSPYTQYEKEEPELKGPIKDVLQYKEYVKEYQEKYLSYSSLSKILELYREEFSKLGKDLEACKGRDAKRYSEILEQMRSSFHECGEKHKRLKKIYIVLYEELKHLKEMIKDYAALYKKG